MFFNKAGIKHWEKLARTLSKFVASLHHCSDWKNCDFKITFVELFYVVCFQWFELVSQKTVNHLFIDVKRLLRMQTPVFVSSNVTKSLTYHRKFLGFYHKQIIA